MENNNIVHDEEWRDVSGYNGLYKVSNLGRIKSFHFNKEYIKKQTINDWGYPTVGLCGLIHKPRKGKQVKVHKLVMLAFVGEKPKGLVCCHNDGNPKNNCIDNLRYDTEVGNQADRYLHGTRTVGERNGKTKLTNIEVLTIRRNHKIFGIKNMANFFTYSYSGMRGLIKARTWRHI